MGISPYASAADFLVLLSGQPLPVSENVSAHIRLLMPRTGPSQLIQNKIAHCSSFLPERDLQRSIELVRGENGGRGKD